MQKAIPKTTLAIILGASKFPKIQSLESNTAFKNSATSFRKYLLCKFGLSKKNLLYLFNANFAPSTIDEKIANFIGKSNGIRDIIIYYVGHGDFATNEESSYLLVLYNTRQEQKLTSGYLIQALAVTLKEYAPHIRKYIILDCCFSSVCYRMFQSTPAQIVIQQTKKVFDCNKGTALLCAANKDTPAKALPGYEYTMFSTALLDVLNNGNHLGGAYLSFKDVGNFTEQRIKEIFKNEAVRPEVLSPYQKNGDIIEIPFFPNIGYNDHSEPDIECNDSKSVNDGNNHFINIANKFNSELIFPKECNDIINTLKEVLRTLPQKISDSTKHNSLSNKINTLIKNIKDYKNNQTSVLRDIIKYNSTELGSLWKSIDTSSCLVSQNIEILQGQKNFKDNLVQKVANCPCMVWGRIQNVVDRLPIEISRNIKYSDIISDYIENIVNTVLNYPDGLETLIKSIEKSDNGTIQFEDLKLFIYQK